MGKKFSRKKLWVFNICGILLLAGLIYVGLPLCIGYAFVCALDKALDPTHDLAQYSRLRSQWDQDQVAHFPSEIPAEASLKKFSHAPGFLQGGGHIQLRLQLPHERILELYNQFSKQRTVSCRGNEHCSMPTTYFYTYKGKPEPFSNDFEIMVFDKYIPEKFQQKSHGVAISTESNEIVYWAEYW